MDSEGTQIKNRRGARWIAGTLALIFAVGWLLPLTYVGFTEREIPGVGRFVNFTTRVSCLFPRRVKSWDDWFFEVRLEGGAVDSWIEVPDSDLGSMRPFGAGTRLYRVLATGGGDRNRVAVLQSLAVFVGERYEELHPESARVAEVRFVRVRYPVGSPELTESGGRWRIPKLASIPPEDRVVARQYVVGESRIEERGARSGDANEGAQGHIGTEGEGE